MAPSLRPEPGQISNGHCWLKDFKWDADYQPQHTATKDNNKFKRLNNSVYCQLLEVIVESLRKFVPKMCHFLFVLLGQSANNNYR